MKEVNEHLEGDTPVWDSNLGRWIEPTEVLDTGDEIRNERLPTDGDWPEIPTNPHGNQALGREYNRRWGAAGIKP